MENEGIRVLWREDLQKFEDNLGNFYIDIEDIIKNNIEYFSTRDVDLLKHYWTAEAPRRINLNDNLTWEIDF